MSKKRIGYIATVLIILAAVTAALCVFLTLRSRNNDEGQEGTEQESAVLPEESDLELPPEIETVSVETDDAVSELYRTGACPDGRRRLYGGCCHIADQIC